MFASYDILKFLNSQEIAILSCVNRGYRDFIKETNLFPQSVWDCRITSSVRPNFWIHHIPLFK